MNRDKTTLILTNEPFANIDWRNAEAVDSRLITVHSLDLLLHSIYSAQRDFHVHVARVILDGSVTAGQWLELLTSIPLEFSGDMLWIDSYGGGYLSASGRSGDRALYRITAEDIPFYLEASGISTPDVSLSLPETARDHIFETAVM